MKKSKKNRVLPKKVNHYSIRKFSMGTASIMLGATLLFSIDKQAEAAESPLTSQGENKADVGDGDKPPETSTETPVVAPTEAPVETVIQNNDNPNIELEGVTIETPDKAVESAEADTTTDATATETTTAEETVAADETTPPSSTEPETEIVSDEPSQTEEITQPTETTSSDSTSETSTESEAKASEPSTTENEITPPTTDDQSTTSQNTTNQDDTTSTETESKDVSIEPEPTIISEEPSSTEEITQPAQTEETSTTDATNEASKESTTETSDEATSPSSTETESQESNTVSVTEASEKPQSETDSKVEETPQAQLVSESPETTEASQATNEADTAQSETSDKTNEAQTADSTSTEPTQESSTEASTTSDKTEATTFTESPRDTEDTSEVVVTEAMTTDSKQSEQTQNSENADTSSTNETEYQVEETPQAQLVSEEPETSQASSEDVKAQSEATNVTTDEKASTDSMVSETSQTTGEKIETTSKESADASTQSEDTTQVEETTSTESLASTTETSQSEDTSQVEDKASTETTTSETSTDTQASTEDQTASSEKTETPTSNDSAFQEEATTTPSNEDVTESSAITSESAPQTEETSVNTDAVASNEEPQTEAAPVVESMNTVKEVDATSEASTSDNTVDPATVDANKADLTEALETSDSKTEAVNDYLTSNLNEAEAAEVQSNIDPSVDLNTASTEEIQAAVDQAVLKTVSDDIESNQLPKTTVRSMSTMTYAGVAAVDANTTTTTADLPYSENYTFQTIMFDPQPLTSDQVLKGNTIPFEIHDYMTGSNSGDRYKVDLQLDPVIADHVTRITVNSANQNEQREFTRLKDADGNLTDTWEVNFIRANNGLFGGAEILKPYTATGGKIYLDDTVGNIVNSTDVTLDKLDYRIYVRDSETNTIIKTADTSGYFVTKDNYVANLPTSTSTTLNNQFKASNGSVKYEDTIGNNGGFIVDQTIMKNGIFDYNVSANTGTGTKQFSYNYMIDPDLIPYIDHVELHRLDFQGVTGFDQNYYPANKVADLKLNADGTGSITDADMNKLIEFNNSTPESVGIRMVVVLNQDINNILTKDGQYDENGNLIIGTSDIKEDFNFSGYLADKNGGVINNTYGNSTLFLQDADQDGLLDSYENKVTHTNPSVTDTDNDGKNDGDEVKNYQTSPLVGIPEVPNMAVGDTVVKGTVPLAPNLNETQTVNIVDQNQKVIGISTVNADGTFNVTIPSSPEGQYHVQIVSPSYANPEVNTFEIINYETALQTEISPVNDQDTTITVEGHPGSTVTVKASDGSIIGTTVIPEDGTSGVVQLNEPLAAGTVITSTATLDNHTGQPSNPVTVSDVTAPSAPVINPVTSEDTSVTGMAEPNSTVTITYPDGSITTVSTDENGNYTSEIPDSVNLQGGETISATSTDQAGNESEETATTVTDTTMPEAPTVGPVTSEDATIIGTSEPGSTVTVTFPDGSTSTAVSDADGNYVVAIPESQDLIGGENISVKATDEAGNVSGEASTTVQDTSAPKAPVVNQVTSEDTAITGQAEPGSTVIVNFPDGSTSTDVADNEGNYSIEIPADIDLTGGETLPITATDQAGNTSPSTSTTVSDVTAPDAPVVDPVTSEDTTITGQAEPGSTVTVTFPDGSTSTGLTDESGHYVIAIPDSQDFSGGETINVISTDEAGNDSAQSTAQVTDVTAPDTPVVNPVTSEDTTITGQAEPGSTVTVTFPNGTTSTATTTEDGSYTVVIPEGVDLQGNEVLPVTSTDKAGNESGVVTTTVSDATNPETPTVNPISSEDTTLSGTAEPNSTVSVTFPDGSISTVVTDDSGHYEVAIPESQDLVGGESLVVTSTDEAGNTSNEASVTVSDVTPPEAPVVDAVDSNDIVITGQAEPGSTVTVTFPDGVTGTGIADETGQYIIEVPDTVDLTGGEVLPVSATDKAGNESGVTTTTVSDVTAPSVPSIQPVTSDDTFITGNAEPGSTVTVTFPDGSVSTGLTDAEGNYTIAIPENIDLVGGETLPVMATDASGNASSEATTTVQDTTPPEAPVVNPISSEDTVLTGIAEPGATVTVTFEDGTTGSTIADAEGNYTIVVPNTVDLIGGEVLPVTATDGQGNQSQTSEVIVTDMTAPTTPTVFPVTSEDSEIIGTGEPGSTVTITFPDGSSSTTTVNEDGSYTMPIPETIDLVGDEVLVVTSTDEAGNASGDVTTTVTDATTPETPVVNPVTSEDTNITGIAEPGSTVTVSFPDGTTGTGVANDEGQFVISIPESVDLTGGEVLPVTATDKAGNESGEATTTVEDTSAPNAPTINPVTSEDGYISGVAEAGSTVTVTFPDGSISTAIVDANGDYTIAIPEGVDLTGGEVLPITATDQNNNQSEASSTTVEDVTAPDAPVVNPVTSEDVVVTGQAEPGSTVTVEFPNGITSTATADENGHYVVDIPEQLDLIGGETLNVTASDSNGNTSEQASTDVADQTPPLAPTVNPVTSEDTQISGTAEPNTTVTIAFPNGTTSTVTADDNGDYVLDIPENIDLTGDETLTVTATDASDNTSTETTTTVTDSTAPNVPTVNPVTSEDTQITGTAEPGSTVTVTFPDGSTTTGTVDENGNYVVDIPSNVDLTGGETLPITSTDNDGNTSEQATTTVSDATAPDAPTVNPVTSEDTTITGQAEPGSTVTVTFPDGSTSTGVADENGNYVVAIPTDQDLTGNEPVVVTTEDKAGNTSAQATTTVQDVTPPVAPTINPVTSEDTTITGTAEPGSTVTVMFEDGTTGSAITDAEGNYTITIPEGVDLVGGKVLPIIATDDSGNASNETTTTVTDTTAPVTPTINPVSSDDTTITGQAEPGSTVTVTFPDGTTSTGITDENGAYVIVIPEGVDLTGGETLPIVSTDDSGNASQEASTTVVDTTAPETPSINPVTSEDATITGTAEPGSTVTVTFPDGTTSTATTDESGQYVIHIPSSVDLVGGETLPITSTDKDGNESGEAVTTVEDTTPPLAPVVNPVTSEDSTVTGTAEPGSTVTVTFPDGSVSTGLADPEGNYTIAIPENVELVGGENIVVNATDETGNASTESSTTVEDVTPPSAPTINPVTSEDATITGQAEPGSTVTVTFPDGTTSTTIADENGNYVIDIPTTVDFEGGETIPVTAKDEAGNQSTEMTTTVTDTTAPSVPTVNPVTSEDTQVTGTAEPGSTVTVTFPDGTTSTGTADENGNYVVDIPSNVDLTGGETLPITSTDKDGNESEQATTTVTDATAPTVPTVNPVTSEDTQVTGTAEPGSNVTVTFPDGTTSTGTADENGNYVVDIPSNVDLTGGETLPITSTDKDGNESEQATTTITDTTAPTVPTVNPVTSEDTTVTGTAEPGSTVTVTFPDGSTSTGVTDENGHYVVAIPNEVDLIGNEVLVVDVTDQSGNVSDDASVEVEDTTQPSAPIINPVTSEDTTVTGTAEPGSTVTVTFPDGTTSTGIADENGNYVVEIPSNVDLTGGETLPITATDEAGNESEQATTTVTDISAPTVPTVNPVTSEDTQVTGTAEPGSTVTVTFPDGSTATGTADEDGNYVVEIPSNVDLTGGETLPITSTDKDGNESEQASTTVTDTTAPTVPTVNPVTSEGTQVTGTAEPGSTVTVTFPDGTTSTGTADENGNYVVEIPSNVDLTGGETLPITSTDKDGNESEQATTTITDTTAPTVPTVNPVTSEDAQVTGTAEPGSTVTVTFPDGSTSSGTADENGNYVVEIPSNVDLTGDETLVVQATDKDNNTSNEATINVQDTTAPTVPTINEVTSDDAQITGTAEPGSTVTVTFPDGTTSTAITDGEGNYVVDIPSNVDLTGGEILPVTATDQTGNTSEEAATTVTDTTAPNAPVVYPVTSESTEIKGEAEPGSTVTVTFPDGSISTGITDEDGNYTIAIPETIDLVGNEHLEVVATDKDDNASEQSNVTVSDTTVPEAPIVDPVTSDATEITGTAEPGSTVTVTFPDGSTSTSIVNEDGSYVVSIPEGIDLIGGETLPVKVTDASGNESNETTTTVTDTTKPSVPTIDPITSEDTQITGTAEPGSTVTVTFPDGSIATGETDETGHYVISIPPAKDLEGGEVLPVISTDKNGYSSDEAIITVTDQTAPDAPTINPVNSEDTQITGTAEPGSTVTVTFPDGTTGTATTDDNGNYVIEIPPTVDLTGGETLPVTATDTSNNQSETSTVTVSDKTSPETPTVNPITSEDSQITGTTEPGSTVTVTFPDGTTSTTTTDENGNYVIDIPEGTDLEGSETISVTATDKDGNQSETATTTVVDKTAPEAPTINPVTSEDTQVTGTAEPGTTVTVVFPDGTTGSTTTDENGNYVIPIPEHVDLTGGETLEVSITDKGNNQSDNATTTVTDTTAPSVPTVNPVTSEDTTVVGTAEPGSTVTVTFPNGSTVTTTTNEEGNYEVKIPEDVVLIGNEIIHVHATDQDGNDSEEASTTVKDVTPPEKPTVNPVNESDAVITGHAEPGSTITVAFPDETTSSTTVNQDGSFEVQVPPHIELTGDETLVVTATDQAHNTSDKAEVTVTDLTKPARPHVDDVFIGDDTISGTGEPNTTIKVNLPNGEEVTTTVDQNGEWVVEVPRDVKLEGQDTIKVVSIDTAYNLSKAVTSTVTDQEAQPVINPPQVNPIDVEKGEVTGTSEPGQIIRITYPNVTTTTTKADENGQWHAHIPEDMNLEPTDTILVTASNERGSTSDMHQSSIKQGEGQQSTARETSQQTDKGSTASEKAKEALEALPETGISNLNRAGLIGGTMIAALGFFILAYRRRKDEEEETEEEK
ncbi:YSIRK-type signal peptide-containing protein [Staphylococcus massiliensis]|uniref:Ig-like domain-containing protein n=1 Tax=Staphylococcus massiliensis TaxID=555791 RepID=UPI001EDE6CA3|nr:Ig-like domain-containing protein [Staphylococcus massiliensis]MCG3402339.1 YSIRK-type signal peptide-containing protein [Staphylococcus massiliensis]